MKLRMLCSIFLLSVSSFAQTAFDWTAVETALGRKGSLQPGNVYKFGLPRTDLNVKVGDVQIKPAFALGGWLAFTGTGEECVAMGDLVVTEADVPSVVKAALARGIAITAIHNHVLNESPRIMYVHVGGHFTVPAHHVCVTDTAQAFKAVLAATHLPAESASVPTVSISHPLEINQGAIETALNAKGKVNGGVLQFSIPRTNDISMHGMLVPPAMGTATTINFQPVGGTRAAITGDFVMTGAEVPKVMKVLQEGGIEPTALHSHMIDEEPRLFFMHFWAVDDATKLATTLQKALEEMNPVPPAVPK